MASEKEMTLYFRIKASGAELSRVFGQGEAGVKRLSDALGTLRGAGSTAFSILGTSANVFFKPLELAAKSAAGLAASLVALGGAALNAAADDQVLIERLTGVYGSAEKATSKLEELEKISRNSQFTTEDLTEATLMLEQVGMGGAENLMAIAKAAWQSGDSVASLAQGLSTLQMRNLKKMGIEVEEKDGSSIYTFQDKMGKIQTIVANGAKESRAALVKIFDLKFFDVGKGLKGILQQIRNGLEQVGGNFGKGLLPAAEGFVKYLSEKVNALIESGTLEEWGKKAGAWLQEAAQRLQAAFETIGTFWSEMKAGGAEALGDLAALMAQVFMNYLVAGIEASVAIWKGIGQIVAAAIGEELLQLPGMGIFRTRASEKTLDKMTPNEVQDWSTKAGYTSGPLTPEQEASLAMYKKNDMLRAGIQQFTETAPTAFANAGSASQKLLTDFGNKHLPQTKAAFGANFSEIQNQAGGGGASVNITIENRTDAQITSRTQQAGMQPLVAVAGT